MWEKEDQKESQADLIKRAVDAIPEGQVFTYDDIKNSTGLELRKITDCIRKNNNLKQKIESYKIPNTRKYIQPNPEYFGFDTIPYRRLKRILVDWNNQDERMQKKIIQESGVTCKFLNS